MLHLWNLDGAEPKDQPVLAEMHKRLEPYVEEGFLLANFQVPGSAVQDCDVIFAAVLSPETSAERDVLRHGMRNVVLLIEVKQHADYEIRDGALHVRYPNKPMPSNASRQLKNSQNSLIRYLTLNKDRFGLAHVPFVYRLLYLPSASPSPQDHPIVQANAILKGQFTMEAIAERLAQQRSAMISSFGTGDEALRAYRALQASFQWKPEKPARLDRARVEQLTRTRIQENTQYIEKLGQQLLLFKGQAGTGKTTRLLSLARKIDELGQSASLLTFNLALACDVRRLLDVYRSSTGQFPLEVGTISAILYQAAEALASEGERKEMEEARHASYEEVEALTARILRAAMDGPDRSEWRELLMEIFPVLNADFLLVDEGQDWSELEVDFLRWMAGGFERIVVAQGPDQKTRRYSPLWDDLAPRSRRQVVPLQVNLRQKSALHAFNRALSRLIGEDWTDAAAMPDTGQIRFVPDSEVEDSAFWKSLLAEPGLSAVDVLVAEPNHRSIRRTKEVLEAARLPSWVFQEEKRTGRDALPGEVRILPYESMRGLESWICILRAVDLQSGILGTRIRAAPQELIFSDADVDREILRNLRIASTRPIDTLVITYRNPDHRIVQALRRCLS